MNTLATIEKILDTEHLPHTQVSETMVKFSLYDQDQNIGYMSLTRDNKILCRFYYKTPVLSYATTFIYTHEKFLKEVFKAQENYLKMCDKAVDEKLYDPLHHILAFSDPTEPPIISR